MLKLQSPRDLRTKIFHLHKLMIICLIVSGILMLAGVALADPVAKVGDKQYDSLDEAFDAVVASGGTLTILQDTTWTKDVNITNEVTVEGNNHAITVQTPNTNFNVNSDGRLVLKDITISGASSGENMECLIIIASNATAELYNVIIKDRQMNTSSDGASTIAVYGTLVMNDSWIKNCTTMIPCNVILVHGSLTMQGGGIENSGYSGVSASPGWYDGPISNYGESMGGSSYKSASLSIDGASFSGNAGGYAGAIFMYLANHFEINNTTFSGNKGYTAGSIMMMNCNAKIDSTDFTENTGHVVGAVYFKDCDVIISNSVFTKNTAQTNSGGAIYGYNCSISLSNSEITGNSANAYGGGVYKTGEYSSLTLEGINTICNNTAGSGGADIFNYGGTSPLPSARAMNRTFHDTRFLIDGWYDDSPGYRWPGTGTTYIGDSRTIGVGWGVIAAYTAYDEIEITKTWDDLNDILDKRPDSLTFSLVDKNTQGPIKLRTYDATAGTWVAGDADAKITLDAADFTGNVWTGTIGPLLVDDYSNTEKYILKEDYTGNFYTIDGPTITYTADPEKEGAVPGSDPGVYSASFTNHGPVQVSIYKIWDDVNNKDNIRPTALNTQLVIGSTPQADVDGETVFRLTEDPTTKTWSKTVYLLPVDRSELLATEDQTIGYTQTLSNKSVASDGTITFLFVNSHTLNPAATDTVANESMVNIQYNAAKTWSGTNPAGDKKLPRPEITVSLYEGDEIVDSVVIPKDAEGDPVTMTFPKPHPKYKDNDGNQVIVYTIKEEVTDSGWVKVADNEWYSLDGMGKYKGTITDVTAAEVESAVPYGPVTAKAGNAYTTLQATTTVDVTKLWKDHQNENGARPKYLKLGLFAPDGTNAAEVTINGPLDYDEWTGTFTGLPLYDTTGAVIDYSTYEVREAYPATLNPDGTPASWSAWIDDGGSYTIDKDGHTYTYDYSVVTNP